MNLTSDPDFNTLLNEMVTRLTGPYSEAEAAALVADYYAKFTDPVYCKGIGVPVQDHDFFWHESAGVMALRAHYYLGLRRDPNPHAFIEWRKSVAGGAQQAVQGDGPAFGGPAP